MEYKIPLLLTPQPEGGYTVTSPLLPELVTEGNSLDEALENVKDALLQSSNYIRIWGVHYWGSRDLRLGTIYAIAKPTITYILARLGNLASEGCVCGIVIY